MAEIKLNAKSREISTKGKINELRRQGFVPGVFYIKNEDPIYFYVPESSLRPLVYTTEMHLVDLIIDEDKNYKSIVKDVQFDPITDKMIHVDLQGITVGQAIEVQVPILLTGQAIGIKEGGRLQQVIHKLDVECLPKDIPEQLEVDITNLKIGDNLLVKDLSYDNIKILTEEDAVIVTILAPKGTEEEEAEAEELGAEAPAEPEVISKSKSDEEDQG